MIISEEVERYPGFGILSGVYVWCVVHFCIVAFTVRMGRWSCGIWNAGRILHGFLVVSWYNTGIGLTFRVHRLNCVLRRVVPWSCGSVVPLGSVGGVAHIHVEGPLRGARGGHILHDGDCLGVTLACGEEVERCTTRSCSVFVELWPPSACTWRRKVGVRNRMR